MTPLDLADRTEHDALRVAVANHIANGWRVESQTNLQAVLVKGHRPNHLLHFFIGLLTIGVWWLFVWLPLILFSGEKRRVLTVDGTGEVKVRKS